MRDMTLAPWSKAGEAAALNCCRAEFAAAMATSDMGGPLPCLPPPLFQGNSHDVQGTAFLDCPRPVGQQSCACVPKLLGRQNVQDWCSHFPHIVQL